MQSLWAVTGILRQACSFWCQPEAAGDQSATEVLEDTAGGFLFTLLKATYLGFLCFLSQFFLLKLVGMDFLPHPMGQVLTEAEDRCPHLYAGTNQETYNVQWRQLKKVARHCPGPPTILNMKLFTVMLLAPQCLQKGDPPSLKASSWACPLSLPHRGHWVVGVECSFPDPLMPALCPQDSRIQTNHSAVTMAEGEPRRAARAQP